MQRLKNIAMIPVRFGLYPVLFTLGLMLGAPEATLGLLAYLDAKFV